MHFGLMRTCLGRALATLGELIGPHLRYAGFGSYPSPASRFGVAAPLYYQPGLCQNGMDHANVEYKPLNQRGLGTFTAEAHERHPTPHRCPRRLPR